MRLKVTATRIMRRVIISSKSPVNGFSIKSRTASGRASYGDAVSGMGVSAAGGAAAVAGGVAGVAVAGGGVVC